MRKHLLILFAIYAGCVSCSKQQFNEPENELFSAMVEYSQHFDAVYGDINYFCTKSNSIEAGYVINDDIDDSLLKDEIVNYIDLYTKPENISEWDEHKVLDLISKDSSLDYSDKIVFAKSISFAYYIKQTIGDGLTKTVTVVDCYKSYKKASRRALTRAIVTLAIGLFEPTFVGEALAVSMYSLDMINAQDDYNECLASVSNE